MRETGVASESADAILGSAREALSALTGVELEFSLELRPALVVDRGRFTIWTPAETGARERIETLLACHGAPDDVREALRGGGVPVRYGFGVSITDHDAQFRLYVHERDERTADRYSAFAWQAGKASRRAAYTFSYFPSTPAGVRPLDVAAMHREVVAELLADERLQSASGFWLRSTDGQTFDRLDLAYPWAPRARSLPGLATLAKRFGIPLDHSSGWADLCVRHISFAPDKVTLYASAALADSAWPRDEDELHAMVRRRSQMHHLAVEETVFRQLPPIPSVQLSATSLGRFYDVDIDVWRELLGAGMHYHHGIFDTGDVSDDAMQAALRRAVTDLYPFIPGGARVYDAGCGWGGPLAMLISEKACVTLGVTVSRTQYEYVARLGLPVRWADMECTLPPGKFDCVLMLESFEHVIEKQRLLRVLRRFATRLVMRTNCQDRSAQKTAFADTMHMISSSRLRELLDETGWRVVHWRDRRREAISSVVVWDRRLHRLGPTGDPHIEVFRAWTARVLANRDAWVEANPLMEVVADA